jgi:hypothetical protein
MSTFAVTDQNQLLPAVNYLLSNLDTQSFAGNVVIPGNVLTANTITGVVSQVGNATPIAYLYQWVNLRYSNNATGTAGFDTNSNNYSYFGVYNSANSTPSANPTSYQWFQVSPPFDSATSRTLYYSAIGGRQIQWAAASSPPSSNYVITTANVAIDLDVVTTAAGTPGERGPVVMAGVITTADPNTATAAQLTGWFEAPRSNLTAPIGTGLTPVTGDTASFTWSAGPGQPQAAYEYNGSIWIPVSGQVVSGNVIIRGTIAGNAMIANTITATQIATGTITANLIAGNTITANNIATGTLTTNLFTAGTINANIITANTFAANTISGQAIIANTIAANTISGQAIIANTFAANTINGNSITSNSITADKLTANALTANTVVSTGATIGNFASAGFWLQGSTGNARFGNTVSIGNFLQVGNNAQIGGNLRVTGLITSGVLNANTVSTTTVVPESINTVGAADIAGTANLSPTFGFANPNQIYAYTIGLGNTGIITITTTIPNQPIIIAAQAGLQFYVTSQSGTYTGDFYLAVVRRQTSGQPWTIVNQVGSGWTATQGQTILNLIDSAPFPTAVDNPATPGTYTYTFAAYYLPDANRGAPATARLELTTNTRTNPLRVSQSSLSLQGVKR